MNYIEEEIPSDSESVNSVKSLTINETNKLLTDKGRAKSSDVCMTQEKKQDGEFLCHLKNSSLILRRSGSDTKAIKNKVNMKRLNAQNRKLKASTFRNIHINSQRCMDSSEILADMWNRLGRKHNDIHQNDSKSQDSILDDQIEIHGQEI